MSAIPKYLTRAEAMADFEARRCPRWVYVDGWQIDLLAPTPIVEPVELVEPAMMAPSVTHPYEPRIRANHALASTIVAMACGVRWAGLSEEEQARVAALVDEIGRVVRPRSEKTEPNEGAKTMSQTNQTNSINTAHDLQLAACLAAAEGVTAAVSDEADSVARRQIVALRQRYEELRAAVDRISTAIDEHRPSLEPGTFGRFVPDTVSGITPPLVSDVAMGDGSTSGNEPWFAPGGDHPAPVDGGQ